MYGSMANPSGRRTLVRRIVCVLLWVLSFFVGCVLGGSGSRQNPFVVSDEAPGEGETLRDVVKRLGPPTQVLTGDSTQCVWYVQSKEASRPMGYIASVVDGKIVSVNVRGG
jgi:hypothetical protein